MSMLRRSLSVGLVLLALVSVIHTACWHGKTDPGATHCVDSQDNTRHPIGSSWISMCAKCTCRVGYFSCCHRWPTTVQEGCTIEHNYQTCTFKITNLRNPGQPCGAAGK